MAGQAASGGHVTIGDKATIAGRTGVTTNLPGGEVYAGFPAIPFREEMKLRASVRRLPKLVERVKALEEALKSRSMPEG
jgi:UDP-3-O-[3-hydroxymyristoyl] glucosamine N-acyltransferase